MDSRDQEAASGLRWPRRGAKSSASSRASTTPAGPVALPREPSAGRRDRAAPTVRPCRPVGGLPRFVCPPSFGRREYPPSEQGSDSTAPLRTGEPNHIRHHLPPTTNRPQKRGGPLSAMESARMSCRGGMVSSVTMERQHKPRVSLPTPRSTIDRLFLKCENGRPLSSRPLSLPVLGMECGQPTTSKRVHDVAGSIHPRRRERMGNATGQIPIGMSARREARIIAPQEVRAGSTQGVASGIGRLAVAVLDDADVGSLGLDLEWMRQTGERREPSRHPERQHGRP